MNALIFLAIRAVHVAVAALWIGGTVFTAVLLMPAIEDAGAAGGQVMAGMNRRGLHIYMTVLSVSTLVTGLYLLWRFTGGFDAAVVATHAGLAFATGGVAGTLAGVVGGGLVGRSAGRAMKIMRSVAGLPDGPAKGALISEATVLRRRMKVGTRIVFVLQAAALVLMAVGHYI